MTADMDRFRQTLEDGVENELTANAEQLAKSIVATVWNACDDERGRLLEENATLRKRLADEERLHGDTIDDRDHFHEMADKLAYAVAPEEVIGENSSMNCPWDNALELITPKAEVDKLRAELEPYEVLTEQACQAEKHPTWLIDSENHHACPWCEIERLKAQLAAKAGESDA